MAVNNEYESIYAALSYTEKPYKGVLLHEEGEEAILTPHKMCSLD